MRFGLNTDGVRHLSLTQTLDLAAEDVRECTIWQNRRLAGSRDVLTALSAATGQDLNEAGSELSHG